MTNVLDVEISGHSKLSQSDIIVRNLFVSVAERVISPVSISRTNVLLTSESLRIEKT